MPNNRKAAAATVAMAKPGLPITHGRWVSVVGPAHTDTRPLTTPAGSMMSPAVNTATARPCSRYIGSRKIAHISSALLAMIMAEATAKLRWANTRTSRIGSGRWS